MSEIMVKLSPAQDSLPLRERYRQEMNCQITKDSIHQRRGWTLTYLLELGVDKVGFGSVAIAGPWEDKPTIIEFYIFPEYRTHAFDLFEAFLAASNARFFEVQSNDVLLAVMLYTYGREISSESMVFHDKISTNLLPNG